MKLNELRNPFNNFDLSSWSGGIISKINKTLKRPRSEDIDESDGLEQSKHRRVDDVFDSDGTKHDDHLLLQSTKLNDDDDALIYDDKPTTTNDFDDNDDYKANDDYWIGEDPPDDRDDNVLAKHEFDKGYNDDSGSEEDQDEEEEDELDNPDYVEDDEQVDSHSVELGQLGDLAKDDYGEQVVGEVDDNSDRVGSESEDEEEEDVDDTQTLSQYIHEHHNNEPIELSSDSE